MFKSYNFKIPKKYKEEYDKKKRPLSKKSNNIKVFNNNKKSTIKINNFANTNIRFYALNNDKDLINRYIKDDQQYNNLKKDLLNNKAHEKIKFIKQSKDKEENLNYKLKSQEMKNTYKKNGFILDGYNVNEMPKKLFEFNNIEDTEMIINRDFEQKRENKRYDENNYNQNEILNMNNIMILDSKNYSFYYILHIIKINILCSHIN